jgi:hypothetical protein
MVLVLPITFVVIIYADGQLIAINIKTNTTAGTPPIPDKTRYLHYDNLPTETQ